MEWSNNRDGINGEAETFYMFYREASVQDKLEEPEQSSPVSDQTDLLLFLFTCGSFSVQSEHVWKFRSTLVLVHLLFRQIQLFS